ncbi:NAD-dependent protein deacetylase sirtuin-2-like [Ylistrum balloti]|uniref:NAD-dependent protein deacetylase sirtuin-2-like n=1 Tax=Ylistrum balloti TaxID=509963 RepID=UPI002905CCB4|nr:NAD-dependent protein deacetylase sirtuin-2-like [Ylistrum balloti]
MTSEQTDGDGSTTKPDMKWYFDRKTKQIVFGDVSAIEPDSEEMKGPDSLLYEVKKKLDLGPPPVQLLDTLDIDGVVNFIRNGNCKNIITMVGAGISTSAGIPDFRSPVTGLYDNLQKYDVPYPEAMFDLEFFQKNPEPFFSLAKDLWPGIYKPTPCHYFIKLLHSKGLLLRHYTQNIDTLEIQSGLDPEKLIEAHGSFRTSKCLTCKKEYSKEFMEDKVMAGVIPVCDIPECNGIIKPDIVFFGDTLPKRFAECVEEDFQKCDLLIIMGTSLVVQPFASLSYRVPANTPRLYINLVKTGTEGASIFIFFTGAFKFDEKDNYRDVFWQGTCDDGCFTLAEKLGWKDELSMMIKKEHTKINKEMALLKSKSKHLRGKSTEPRTGNPGKARGHTGSKASIPNYSMKGKSSR